MNALLPSRRTSSLARWAVAISLMLVSTLLAVHPSSAHDGDEHGLGDYGRTGRIEPAMVDDDVSPEALAVAQSSELARARETWEGDLDFVAQVDYQLTFRQHFDYLSADPAHLGKVLEARSIDNSGYQRLRLFLTDEEAEEFDRRNELGDRIPEIRRALGVQDPDLLPEGQDPRYGENFAGIWQDQEDGGRIVVALVDTSVAREAELANILGGPENLKLIEVEHSWNEINAFRDWALEELGKRGVAADVLINSVGHGRVLEIITPDPKLITADFLADLPAELVSVTQGETARPTGGPSTTHSAGNQQPGLEIEIDPGGWCTWGINGHTNNWNYIVTAGHCVDGVSNGWSNLEIHQNNSFHLTPGDQYVYWRFGSGWDMGRVSSSYADDNCYHGGLDCDQFIRYRALHNSWEVNSDTTCLSGGASNNYKCGLIREENYTSTSTDCVGSRWVRIDIAGVDGNSGGGYVSGAITSNPSAAAIDGIQSCRHGATGGSFGNTAYDVKTQLAGGFDFNCASSKVIGRSAGVWGSCPTFNR